MEAKLTAQNVDMHLPIISDAWIRLETLWQTPCALHGGPSAVNVLLAILGLLMNGSQPAFRCIAKTHCKARLWRSWPAVFCLAHSFAVTLHVQAVKEKLFGAQQRSKRRSAAQPSTAAKRKTGHKTAIR